MYIVTVYFSVEEQTKAQAAKRVHEALSSADLRHMHDVSVDDDIIDPNDDSEDM